jgi:hypothetical protein
MLPPTLTTWVLVIFGLVFVFAILLYGQILMVLQPHSRKTKDLLIGKGEDWRDKTHLRFSVGGAWADLLFWLPALLAGSVGVLFGYRWGYVLWAVSGGISAYISIILWFTEKEYVYSHWGPLIYFTVYWGFPIYWGLVVVLYSVLRLSC